MRMTKRVLFFTAISLLTFFVGVLAHRSGNRVRGYLNERATGRSAWRILLSFENQDLMALDERRRKLVQRAIDELTGSETGGTFGEFAPAIFKNITNTKGETRYLLVEEEPLMTIPGHSTLRVHIFDDAGHLLSGDEFPLENRTRVTALQVRKMDLDRPQDVLVARSDSYLGGHPTSYWFAVIGDQLSLVLSLSDSPNVPYRQPSLVGPTIIRSAEEWERMLHSSDSAEVLSALMWLEGYNFYSDVTLYDQVPPEARKALLVWSRESVGKRLNQLSQSGNYWIQESAKRLCCKDR